MLEHKQCGLALSCRNKQGLLFKRRINCSICCLKTCVTVYCHALIVHRFLRPQISFNHCVFIIKGFLHFVYTYYILKMLRHDIENLKVCKILHIQNNKISVSTRYLRDICLFLLFLSVFSGSPADFLIIAFCF